jgi:hypothetical protein
MLDYSAYIARRAESLVSFRERLCPTDGYVGTIAATDAECVELHGARNLPG